MSTETLTTILISLLIINFSLWIAFLVFIFFKTRLILKKVELLVENLEHFSSSFVGSVVKVFGLGLGLLKGFNTVKSITTLSDIFDGSSEEDDKNGKKRK